MTVFTILSEDDIRLYWGRLTREQQETFTEASVAYRKAKQLVSEIIIDSLDD